MLPQFQHRAIHLAFALALTFFIFPATNKQKEKLPLWDIGAIIFSLGVGVYLTLDYMNIVFRWGSCKKGYYHRSHYDLYSTGATFELWVGLLCVAVASFSMPFGHLIPDPWRQYEVARIIEHMF